jgi:hypothetical protein
MNVGFNGVADERSTTLIEVTMAISVSVGRVW